jgi:hypothetical protein
MVIRALLLVLAVAPLAGCLKSAAFSCSVETDCTRGGEIGTCEPTGFCSFADASCPSGRRYGELSGALANVCVGMEPTPDAPDDQVDAAIDAPDAPPAAPFCDAAGEPTLVGCWEFEGNSNDASGDNNNGTNTNVVFVAGQVGMAAQLAANSHIQLADSVSLQPPAITIEGWIRPTSLPVGGSRQGIVDNNNSYGFFIVSNPAPGLQCVGAGVAVALTPNVYQHVACVYDATGNRIYLNGVEIAAIGPGAPLGAGDATGAVLGGNSNGQLDTLVGEIDQFRIWNVGRTAQQICTAAGLAVCP